MATITSWPTSPTMNRKSFTVLVLLVTGSGAWREWKQLRKNSKKMRIREKETRWNQKEEEEE